MKYGKSKQSKALICEIMEFVRIFWKKQHPRGLLDKTNSEKNNFLFFLVTSGLKNSIAVSCMGKESITLSMELAKTQCYEFEGFENNYSLTMSTQGCGINSRKFNTKGK